MHDQRYLDSGCSTHMWGRKYWFVIVNHAMKNKLKSTVDTTLATEGTGDVPIEIRGGRYSLIKNVLYIPGIKCNILCIVQLLERGYKIHMENKELRVMDANRVLILKAHMATNRTLKVELKVMKHMGLTTTASRE